MAPSARTRSPGGPPVALLAAVAYVACWVAGISAWPTNLSITAAPSAVVAAYQGHAAQALIQYALVEGVAGALIAVLALLTARRHPGHRPAGASRGRQLALGCASAASCLSVVQWLLGCALVAATRGGHPVGAGHLFSAVNLLDGAKMTLLAVAALAVGVARLRKPRGLSVLSVTAGIALLASGAAYLARDASGDWLVYLSGPLLLAWALGVACWPGTAEEAVRRRVAAGGVDLQC